MHITSLYRFFVRVSGLFSTYKFVHFQLFNIYLEEIKRNKTLLSRIKLIFQNSEGGLLRTNVFLD